jgi:hypothetical protein
MNLRAICFSAIAVLFMGCVGPGGTKVDVTFNGTSVPLDIRSTGVYPSTKTFSIAADGQTTITKAANHYIALASFEMDTKGPVTMGKALTNEGQVRVVFQIVGEEGTDEKAAVKTGMYPTKCEKYVCVDYLNIARFTGGKEEKTSIDTRKADGDVKITSVTDDSISGEINITEGQNSVKGMFTAKITTKR